MKQDEGFFGSCQGGALEDDLAPLVLMWHERRIGVGETTPGPKGFQTKKAAVVAAFFSMENDGNPKASHT